MLRLCLGRSEREMCKMTRVLCRLCDKAMTRCCFLQFLDISISNVGGGDGSENWSIGCNGLNNFENYCRVQIYIQVLIIVVVLVVEPERPPSDQEVVGSIPGRTKPKTLTLVLWLVASSLDACIRRLVPGQVGLVSVNCLLVGIYECCYTCVYS